MSCLAWLKEWQTLAGAAIALLAAALALYNTTRTIRGSTRLETRRRDRKLAAVRAVLPLALAQVSTYAEHSARALDELAEKCKDDLLPPMSATTSLVQSLPAETLKTLSELIEYSDPNIVDTNVVEETVAWVQILDSRIRSLLDDNLNPTQPRIILRQEIEGRIIDAASIYAAASAAFEYARRRQHKLRRDISWDDVTDALRNMRFYEDEYPNLHTIIGQREKQSKGPFAALKT